ncbi:MAG TPA: ComEA family DNA-binding protein [Nocardioides sp.]|uniref:ComEA family DNA-binding protein n=1 Tax=Nocardioides sp. TaxID=35761 RepID=UPI002F41CB14
MRSRSLAAQHDAAVARRLELLTTELAAVRERGPAPDTRVRPAASWSPHGHTRIRALPDPDEPDVDEPVQTTAPVPSVARLPGRHASRRTPVGPDSWPGFLPAGLRGRIALGPSHVAVIAVVSALALALTCWWLLRSGAHEVAAPTALTTPAAALATPKAAAASASAGSAAGTTPPTPSGKVVVDVTGKVRHPGIAVLRQGARVIDAVRAAGGARPGVDLGGLNLARVLTDGEQVVVGAGAVAGTPVSTPAGGSPVSGLVNINTADETTLESLPEVGPVTAQAIITWRTQHGGYTSVDQLLDVDGIGDATLAKLTPYVTL